MALGLFSGEGLTIFSTEVREAAVIYLEHLLSSPDDLGFTRFTSIVFGVK